jgi:hypothetical protein
MVGGLCRKVCYNGWTHKTQLNGTRVTGDMWVQHAAQSSWIGAITPSSWIQQYNNKFGGHTPPFH